VFKTTNVVTRCGRGDNDFGPCVESDVTNVRIPQAAPSFTPTNPKTIITSALPQISTMQDTITARQLDIASGTWNNGTGDVVETFSMPVFMIEQALQAMANVKAVGEKEKKEKKTALILEILGIIFAFIPFLDEIGPSLGLADGAFEIVAATGNIALAIRGIVADPASAPMEILSALTLGKAKSTEVYAALAAAKRAITEDELSDIGTDFRASEDEMETTLTQTCFLDKS